MRVAKLKPPRTSKTTKITVTPESNLEQQHADMKKYKGVSTTYDHARLKRQVLTRYSR